MDTKHTGTITANPYAPPRAAVRDIHQTSAYEPADRGTRLAAAFLDGIILGVMVYLPMFVLAFAADSPGEGGETLGMIGLGLTLVGLVAWAGLNIKYVRENGQSIAKKLLTIKVVRSDGSPATLGRIFWMRNVLNGLISIIPLYGLIDVLFIFGEDRRCLHDKIADTIVVKA